jgi:hypothetical protein
VAQPCTTARRVWGLAMFLRQVKTNRPAKASRSFRSLAPPFCPRAQRRTTARRVWGLAMFLRQVRTNRPAKASRSFRSLAPPFCPRAPPNDFHTPRLKTGALSPTGNPHQQRAEFFALPGTSALRLWSTPPLHHSITPRPRFRARARGRGRS